MARQGARDAGDVPRKCAASQREATLTGDLVLLNLAPGDHVLACMAAAPDGLAHIEHGMIQPIPVRQFVTAVPTLPLKSRPGS